MQVKKVIKWTALSLLTCFGMVAGYLLLWPVPIEPVAWTAPTPPAMRGPYQINKKLAKATRIELKKCIGPESIAVDVDGTLYAGTEKGTVYKISPDGQRLQIFADTGGRPGGLSFDKDGRLIVADLVKGLLAIEEDGKVTILTREVDGKPIRMANDVDVAADGLIYFSDTSSKYDFEDGVYEMMEHRPHGRLLVYDPTLKKTTMLINKLYMANGVAVSSDQTYVLVSEMSRFRIQKYWLKGEKKGQVEPIIDNLPGIPDNITTGTNGIFWVAMPAALKTRNDMNTLLAQPFIRKIIARLPPFMAPAPENYAFILGIDGNGNVLVNLQDPIGDKYSAIASVRQVGDRLYMGSTIHSAIAWYEFDR